MTQYSMTHTFVCVMELNVKHCVSKCNQFYAVISIISYKQVD